MPTKIKFNILATIITCFLLLTLSLKAQWQQLIIPDSIHVYDNAFDTNAVLFIASDHGIFMATDENNWEQKSDLPFTNYITINEHNTIYTSPPRIISRSYDHGNSWDTIYQQVMGMDAIYSTDDQMIIVGGWGGLVRTTDSGLTWSRVLETQNSEVFGDIEANSQGVLFAGSTAFMGGGGLYRSLDNGATWEICGMEGHFITSIEIDENDTLYVGTRGHETLGTGNLFKSLDIVGEQWQPIFICNHVVAVEKDDLGVLYVACDGQTYPFGGVYKSEDEGDTWVDISYNLPTRDFEDLTISPEGFIYIITDGGELYKTAIPVGVKNSPGLLLKEPEIFPQPANDILYIDVKENINEPASLKIYSSSGNLVSTKKGSISGGKMPVEIGPLSPGVYVLHLSFSDRIYSKTIIIY